MQYKNCTKLLLGIQGVEIKNFHNFGHLINFDVETKKKFHIFPCCKSKTDKIHDYRSQKIMHSIAYDGRPIYITLRKRRYVCKNCGKRFYENYNFLEKYYRVTNNVYENVIKGLESLKNFKTIAKENNLSTTTVVRYMHSEILLRNKLNIYSLPEYIGIDEFKGNCDGNKYQFHIYNLLTHETVDILASRSYDELERYFSKIENRKDIKIVAMDLYNPFKKIIKDKFINAEIVADRFHYTRIVMNALDTRRLNLWRNSKGIERRYFKGCKRILMKSLENTTDKEKERLLYLFECSPLLKEAYKLKEEFLKIKSLSTYEEREKAFKNWLYKSESSTLEEFAEPVKTFRQWHQYISNSYKYNFSNEPTKGKNNLIKTLKRISFGFRNLVNFRSRILLLSL